MVIQRWAEVGLFRQAGRVSHALAGALRSLAQDWALMVMQLEHQMLTGNLTLQVTAPGVIACSPPHPTKP